MRRPILALGHQILKESCEDWSPELKQPEQLITDMWETMLAADGCGLAAPQIGQPIKLFIVDSQSIYENLNETGRETYFPKGDTGIRETFINAKIIDYSKQYWEDEEGCLSIPKLFQPVSRPWQITIDYYNANLVHQVRTFSGTTARIIQHEYDHTHGVLYIDHLKPLTKKIIASKLKKIKKGRVSTSYPIKYQSNNKL